MFYCIMIQTRQFIFSKEIMHFIKTFKCIGTKSHTVFSLKLFYLLCFCGYVPRSLLMSLCVLAPLNKLLPFMGKPFFFFPLFISAFICINSFLLLSLRLFYDSFSGFWSWALHLLLFSLSCFLVNAVELLATALPLFHGFATSPSRSPLFLKRW